MAKIENWEKDVRKRDDSSWVYLWENVATGEQLLLRAEERDEKYVVVQFDWNEDISFLTGSKVGFANTQREGKSVAREYMEANVR